MGKIKYKFGEVFKKSNMSFREIAREAGLSHATVVRLARAKGSNDYNVSSDVMQKLADYFEIKNISEFIEYK